MLALKRFSWFSIEFGLIEEGGETKVFGAGILSSTGEIPYSLFSHEVKRRPFVTDEVIATDYDPSRMQDQLFVIPSFAFLRRETGGAGAAIWNRGALVGCWLRTDIGKPINAVIPSVVRWMN